MSPWWLILLPLGAGVLAALLPTRARNQESLLAGAVMLAVAIGLGLEYPRIAAGEVLRSELAWLPSLGVNLLLRVDGFAWMFGMLVSVIGALVVLYARYYLSAEDPAARFYSLLLGFMGAMLGVVLSGNLVQLVVFWELTSLFSFLLIGYWHDRKDARRGARIAFTVTATGGLALLAGVLLLGHVAGSYELDVVLAAGGKVRHDPLYLTVLVLVLLGAFTKSAQFPFHFWLPHAMAAPTPVSAYLHSATMVKMGVFLLARLWPVLAGTDPWFYLVGGAGLVTLVLGAYLAMFHNDLKGVLAYSTISHLGLITLLLALDSPLAAVAAVFHIMNHATFKASLFMAVGVVDHETGTRDMRRLHGLFAAMPRTGTLAIIACAAMGGVPLLNGFLSKEMFFAETVLVQFTPAVEFGLPFAATLASVFAVVYSLRIGHHVFFGEPTRATPRAPHEPVAWMRLPIALLVLACLVVGIVPELSIGGILEVAARPVTGGTLPEYSLSVWHGFNAPFVMSLVALAGGAGLYLLLARQRRLGGLQSAPLIGRLNGKRAFESLLVLALDTARRVLRRTSSRHLQQQVLCMLVVAGATALVSALVVPLEWGSRPRVPATLDFALLWLVGGAAAIGAAQQAKVQRLFALMLLAVVGIVVCVTFAWFSAPDLALTQIAVEAVTMVFFLLGLRWLPKPARDDEPRGAARARWRRRRDLVLAGATGAGLAAVSYALLTRTGAQSISPFYLEKALPEGGGTNVVNVMLVDFRAFDTLGEITVLAAVGLTVFALLRRFRPPRETTVPPPQQRLTPPGVGIDLARLQDTGAQGDPATGYLLVPAVLVRLMLPISLVVAFHLFLRGHNLPGGGFVAGLTVAIALVAQYVVGGTQWVEDRVNLHLPLLAGLGLLGALATGLGSLGLGYPLLTTHTAHFTLPVIGEVHVPSAAFFDLGVFLVVLGSSLLLLTALAHQTLRARRRSPGTAA
ncbi:monovalent cation/H+ antiporter subunit A [Ramlibacter alkalitolerans]|uniref:Monovalent cation/H+ antiporter subunit A n=1 Tax=Ramlibacter alkalitolerans TaxID=2039631 RepID=A0ABS1JTB7_9BURK|nr:monovalent cation/H+ antiporter subunit A [Ramlibacter alkalitolerans]MBL0427520.1 monovalent cation/H+ antiporter subunit A [Ramlibacter alkalitolerans]